VDDSQRQWLIAIEACGGSHHWARLLSRVHPALTEGVTAGYDLQLYYSGSLAIVAAMRRASAGVRA
jgi:hypothetical protein